MASRRAANPPAPTGATTSPTGDGGGAETYLGGGSGSGDQTSRPPLTPLTSRARASRDRDYSAAGIFRTPQQQQQQQQQNYHPQHGRSAANIGIGSSGSGGTPLQRGVHSIGSGGGTPSPSASRRSSTSTSPPSYRSSRHPVQYSRSYGSAGSPNSAGSSMATPRRRGGVGAAAGVGVPPYRRSPSSPADGGSTSGAEFDPYLEVPNLGHADHTMPLYYGTNGGGGLHGGLVPLYDNGGRSNGENGIRGGHHRHAGSGHHGNADSHHNTSTPLCSRKRTRRRAAACVAVVGLIGAQYLYAIQVGSAEAAGSSSTTSAAVEAVAAAVTGAVNDLLGAANGGSGTGGVGDMIAGIASGLGGTDDAASSDENVSDDTHEVVRFNTGTSPVSNTTLARQNRSRQKRVKKEKQRIEFSIPRLLFIGSSFEVKAKKGRKGGGPSLAHLFGESVERLGKKHRNGTSSSFMPWNKVGRKVKIYPPEQTDETQLYPEVDSADPPFNETMLVRSFPPQKGDYFLGSERDRGVGCHPMAGWQSTFHPTCNSFHDIDAGTAMQNDALSFLGAGHWRGAWSLGSTDDLLGEDTDKPVVYKTWSYEHRFEDFYYELNRIDAVAMERLTSSPYAINIYGLCGTSSITQFATETLTTVADSLDSVDKLKLVRKIAKGLSHVHGIGGDQLHASLVHNDLNTAHILLDSDGKTPLIHDFNVAQLLLRDNKEKPCGFASEHWSPQWRSPEEIRSFQSIEHEMLTEKVDIYALGNIIYRFLTGQRAWRLGEGSMTEEYQRDIAKWKSEEGKTPSVPKAVLKLRDNDKYVDALLSLMDQCFAFKPSDRPSANEIVRTIDRLMQGNDKRH